MAAAAAAARDADLRRMQAELARDEAVLASAAKAIEIVFFPAGTRLLTRGGRPSEHLYLVRKGAVRLERDTQTLQVLEEGEIFGFTSLISGRATIDVVVEEDLLAYRLPRSSFEALLCHAPFAGHFVSMASAQLPEVEFGPIQPHGARILQEPHARLEIGGRPLPRRDLRAQRIAIAQRDV